jgi:hypothetical protein
VPAHTDNVNALLAEHHVHAQYVPVVLPYDTSSNPTHASIGHVIFKVTSNHVVVVAQLLMVNKSN